MGTYRAKSVSLSNMLDTARIQAADGSDPDLHFRRRDEGLTGQRKGRHTDAVVIGGGRGIQLLVVDEGFQESFAGGQIDLLTNLLAELVLGGGREIEELGRILLERGQLIDYPDGVLVERQKVGGDVSDDRRPSAPAWISGET